MSWRDLFGLARPAARIAPARPSHVGRLAEIHAGAFARPWGADEFEGFLRDGAVRIEGLFLGRDPLPSGFAMSRVVADEAEILSFALARPIRGRGYAGELLRRHLHTLAHAGAARVHLEVEEGNEPAIALYGRAGFVQSGRRVGYYARPDGSRATALSMTLDLGEQQPGVATA